MAFAGCIVTPSWEQCTLAIMLKLFEADDSWLRDEDDWCQDDILRRGYERMCLAGAMSSTHMKLKLTKTRAKEYLLRAVREHHSIAENDLGGLEFFNEFLCSGIEEIRDTIRLAYELVSLHPNILPEAPRWPKRYVPFGEQRRASMDASMFLHFTNRRYLDMKATWLD